MPWGTDSRDRTSTPIHRALRRRILQRDGYRCQIKLTDRCIGAASTVDHKKPVYLGGTSTDDNVQAACGPCHAKKSSDEGHAAQRERRARLKLPTQQHPGLL